MRIKQSKKLSLIYNNWWLEKMVGFQIFGKRAGSWVVKVSTFQQILMIGSLGDQRGGLVQNLIHWL